MANSLTFNDVDLADYGLTVIRGTVPIGQRMSIPTLSLGRADGGTAPPSVFPVRELVFPVVIRATTAATLATALDNIAYTLNEREDQTLAVDAWSGRYWLARFADLELDRQAPGLVTGELRFRLNDPCAYSTTESEEENEITEDSGESVEFEVGGTEFAYPTITLLADASLTNIVVKQDGTDDAIQWRGTLSSGDTLRIRSDPRTWLVDVMPDGEDAYSASMTLVSGRFPYLLPNATNTVTFTGFTGTATITWRDRYV